MYLLQAYHATMLRIIVFKYNKTIISVILFILLHRKFCWKELLAFIFFFCSLFSTFYRTCDVIVLQILECLVFTCIFPNIFYGFPCCYSVILLHATHYCVLFWFYRMETKKKIKKKWKNTSLYLFPFFLCLFSLSGFGYKS